jgi:UDP-glucose 4-epimerase
MFLLHECKKRGPVVALFGEGLIGSAVLGALCARGGLKNEAMVFSYAERERHAGQLTEIGRRISRLRADGVAGSVSVVWCAGKAGFMTSADQAGAELSLFGRIIDFTEKLASSSTALAVTFHMVSSAGGVFEGQKHITSRSLPSPQRPYGRLKLAQERLLLSSSRSIGKKIYRLSSVYGPIRKEHRMGLVPALIYNGARHRVSQIFGTLDTLRDYIWCGDVGAYIARSIETEKHGRAARLVHLASGKPSSIHEIKRIVEDMLNKKIYVAFQTTYDNSDDITFSTEILPHDWHPIDIRTAARSVYNAWKERGGVI